MNAVSKKYLKSIQIPNETLKTEFEHCQIKWLQQLNMDHPTCLTQSLEECSESLISKYSQTFKKFVKLR